MLKIIIDLDFDIQKKIYLFKNTKAEFKEIKLSAPDIKITDREKSFFVEGNIKSQTGEINKQIKLMQEKILIQRKKMGGVNAARENQLMVQKQIRILENRLDKALVKFNEALAHNKNLREEIDNLRRERVVFDNIYRKLEKELHEKKKQMANIIEISNQAYEARDQAQMEIAAIQQADAKETQEYDETMVSLGKQLEEDKRRKDSVKLQGWWFMTAVNSIEYANSAFNPLAS